MAEKIDLADKIIKTIGHLAQIRQPYEYMWDEIIDFVVHYRRGINSTSSKGLKTGERVYDTTPLQALNLLADGLHGYLVSPSIRWFGLKLPNRIEFPLTNFGNMRKWNGKRADSIPEIKQWLEDSEDVMYSDFLRSNFYETTPEYFRDGGSIGTANMYVEEDVRTGKTIYMLYHPREYYIVEGKDGSVKAVYRKFSYTLDQLVEMFGYEKMTDVDENFKTMYENNPYTETEVAHAVYPRDTYDPQKKDVKNMQWASVWIHCAKSKVLRESGRTFFPHLTWRWRKNGDEWWGRSPSWDAYVEIVKNNQAEKDLMEVQQMMARPPYYATEDLRGKVKIRPKGRTWLSQSQYDRPPKPYDLNLSGFPITLERQDRAQQIIKDFYHTDLFFLLSDAARNKVPLTATQVIEISGERAAIIGTRIGRLHQELMNPAIDIQFSIANEGGRIPPPPDVLYELAGANIEVDYMGPLSQAQKRLFRTQGIFAGLEAAAKVGQLFPSALQNIDEDATMLETLDAVGFPIKAIRPEDKVREMREVEAARRDEIEKAAMLGTLADKMPKMSRAIEKGSVMEKLTGISGGGKQ